MKATDPIRVCLWVILSVVALWATGFFIDHYSSATFLDGAMGNLFATLLGVVVGIPIALELSRYQQTSALASAKHAEAAEGVNRKRSVLTHLRKELVSNRDQVLECRQPLSKSEKRSVLTNPLRYELWTVFSDSGELRYIDNPDLLAALAQAFHEVKATAQMERLLLEVSHFPGIRMQGSRHIDENLIEYITNDDPHLLQSIENALARIENELEATGSK